MEKHRDGLSFITDFEKLDDEEKFLCKISPSRYTRKAVPLAKIIEISISNEKKEVVPVVGVEKFELLKNSHARPMGLDCFGVHDELFQDCLLLAPKTEVVRVYRKPDQFIVNTIKEIIMKKQP